MKLFECQTCGQQLYFENVRCEHCGSTLGYLPERAVLSALAAEGDDDRLWRPLAASAELCRFCANAGHGACNWLVPADQGDDFCRACALNRTIPDLGSADNLARWQKLEMAKHRLVYGLLRFGLQVTSKPENPRTGLAFDFLAEDAAPIGEKVTTGHANGLITINIAEADSALRERARQDMAEPYRTLLGHFRHEVGHHYWEQLVLDTPKHGPFRALFGDERADYALSLQRHYAEGPAADWQQHFVSAYASAHPWEDFAETFAHLLHITDTLETAYAFRLKVDPPAGRDEALSTEVDFDPYRQAELDPIIEAWLPVTYAVNSLNQSMGQPKLYPFVLAPAAIEKLRFVHRLIREAAG